MEETPVHDSKPKVYRELPCELSAAEIAAKADELAQAVGVIEAVEAAKKEDAAYHNTRIKAKSAVAERLAKQVRDRQEMRSVEVRELLVPGAGEVHTFRADTGAVIGERPMTEHEKQRSLFPTEMEVAVGAAPAGDPPRPDSEWPGEVSPPRPSILDGPDPLRVPDPIE
jgi:hypothetical protein